MTYILDVMLASRKQPVRFPIEDPLIPLEKIHEKKIREERGEEEGGKEGEREEREGGEKTEEVQGTFL